jgi:hypothetical protein
MKAGNTEAALEAHRQAVFFAQIYSETANASIPRSLEKIRGPTGVGERLPDRDSVRFEWGLLISISKRAS